MTKHIDLSRLSPARLSLCVLLAAAFAPAMSIAAPATRAALAAPIAAAVDAKDIVGT